jgi:hypothetical protein
MHFLSSGILISSFQIGEVFICTQDLGQALGKVELKFGTTAFVSFCIPATTF